MIGQISFAGVLVYLHPFWPGLVTETGCWLGQIRARSSAAA